MLHHKLRSIWNPDQYQGWGRRRKYFEGWYFKLISPDEKHALAFIPGISMNEVGQKHAFIQVMDGKKCQAEYHTFPAADFRPSSHRFEVELAQNYFSSDEIKLDLPEISGRIKLLNLTPWPKMLGAPGIMGWYSFVPFMECNHGIVSMHHQLEGQLRFHGQTINFSGGRGYVEKDWGRSFPSAYVWMQSNHFSGTDRASLMASVAHIPWLGSYFIGFISGFWLEGRLFKFATYTGARKQLRITNDHVELIFSQPGSELRILAQQAAGTALVSPLSGEMKGKIQESLQATLQVELLDKGQRIFEDTGRNAGLEVAGNIDVLQP
jgi:tocopherol cyclase